MGRRRRRNESTGEESHKALARRHQRLVQRHVPLMAGLFLAGSSALLVFTETFCGPSSYDRNDRRKRDDGISTAIAHAITGIFRAMGASDRTICCVFAAIALASFLILGGVAWILWLKRPAKGDVR